MLLISNSLQGIRHFCFDANPYAIGRRGLRRNRNVWAAASSDLSHLQLESTKPMWRSWRRWGGPRFIAAATASFSFKTTPPITKSRKRMTGLPNIAVMGRSFRCRATGRNLTRRSGFGITRASTRPATGILRRPIVCATPCFKPSVTSSSTRRKFKTSCDHFLDHNVQLLMRGYIASGTMRSLSASA